MSDDRHGELPPLKLRPKRRLLPELELDLRLSRRREEDEAASSPPPPPPTDPEPGPPTEQIRHAEPNDAITADLPPALPVSPLPPIQRPATPLSERLETEPEPEPEPADAPVEQDEPTDADEDVEVEAAPTALADAEPVADEVFTLPAPLPPPLPSPVIPPVADVASAAPSKSAKRPKPVKPPKAAKPPKAPKPERASPAEAAAEPRPRKAPLYWRALRLRHVQPNGWQRAVLLEGVIGAAVVLVLADVATLWTLLVLPIVAAVVVKLHDVLKGALAVPDSMANAATPTQSKTGQTKRRKREGG
jgi:hypothetical protein